MAKKASADLFSYSEFAIAGDMTKRAFQHLVDASAKSPRSVWLPPGGGIRAVKRIAVIGGFFAAGVPLFAAARLTAELVTEFNQYDGEVPSGLGHLARNLPHAAWGKLPRDDIDTDYWYHRALIDYPDLYTPGVALDSDAHIEIVDRTHVYHVAWNVTTPEKLRVDFFNVWDGKSDRASYLGRLDGWDRGQDATFTSAWEMAPLDMEHPDFITKGAAVNAISRAAYRNAVGRVTVNVSLAVRNGLDRIARHRGDLPAKEGGA